MDRLFMIDHPSNPSDSAALTRRFAGLQCSFFALYSTSSFLAYFLLEKGVSTLLIGVLSAIISASSSLSQPLWGTLCDRRQCHRILYIISGLLSPLLYLWILLSGTTAELIICSVLCGAFLNCMQNMSNGWIAGLNKQGFSIDYGVSRSFGSLAFALMAVAVGWAIRLWGRYAAIACMAASGVICALIARSLPRGRKTAPREGDPLRPTLREGLGILLRKRDYVVFLASGFLAMFGISGLAAYYPVRLRELGAGAGIIGVGTFAYAISEVPAMLFYSRLERRFSFHALYSVCLLAHACQCLFLGLAPNYVFAMLAMVLQGLSFGILVPCTQRFTADHIDERYVSTAQLFSSSVCLSASMVFGNLTAGVLSGYFSLPGVFFIMAFVSFCGFLVYMVNRRSAFQNV